MDLTLLVKLTKLGFTIAKGIDTALKEYQKFHGLEETGECDPSTKRSLELPRFCGHPDIIPEKVTIGGMCRWDVPRDSVTGRMLIPWAITAYPPRLDAIIVKSTYTKAWSLWERVCNIQPIFVDDPNRALIQMGTRSIDAVGGILAESELPCGNIKLCRQWYDTNENWVVSDNPTPGQIDLTRVAAHEIGHAMGLNHGPSGNLLAPTYSLSIGTPQAWDIQEMVKRYGEATITSPYPDLITIRIKGSEITIPGYRVTKL